MDALHYFGIGNATVPLNYKLHYNLTSQKREAINWRKFQVVNDEFGECIGLTWEGGHMLYY